MDEYVRSVYMCLCMCVLEDVPWTKCVFAHSNHDVDVDDDDDGDTPPRESYSKHTHAHTMSRTQPAHLYGEKYSICHHTYMYEWCYSARTHTQHDNDDGKTFGKWILRQRTAIIILQEIEQFASLMVFDLDNQASSVNNIYDMIVGVRQAWMRMNV